MIHHLRARLSDNAAQENHSVISEIPPPPPLLPANLVSYLALGIFTWSISKREGQGELLATWGADSYPLKYTALDYF